MFMLHKVNFRRDLSPQKCRAKSCPQSPHILIDLVGDRKGKVLALGPM